MEYLVTAEEMKAYDNATIHCFGVPSLVLMERAAWGCARVILERDRRLSEALNAAGGKKITPPRRTLVLAGCGNNGGDGLAVGRLLAQAGFPVDFVLLSREMPVPSGAAGPSQLPSDPDREADEERRVPAVLWEKCSPETRTQLSILEKYGYPVTYKLPEQEYDIIVDALLGIGLKKKVSGNLARAIEWVNARRAFVLSVDIPSGIQADTGEICGCAVRADVTVTFAFCKRGLALYPGAEYAGEVRKEEIGITPDSFLGSPPAMFTYQQEIRTLLPGRPCTGNKGTFGKVLLAAGSPGMAGAAVLAGEAVLRTGAGMVRILSPEENRVILQTALPEAMLSLYDGTGDCVENAVRWADVIAVGPGLGTGEEAGRILEFLLDGEEGGGKPMVIDADAINLLAGDKELLEALIRKQAEEASRRQLILTPHPGELARLEGCTVAEAVRDAVRITGKWADRLQAAVLCKGARTVVSRPDGSCYLNTSGNSGMAAAGSGDVLTGIAASLLAQGMEAFEAACAGTYLHGLAGDAAAGQKGQYGMTAGDLTAALGVVLSDENAGGRRCPARPSWA